MALYTIYNGAAPTTAKRVAVTTGTAIKTMLQVKVGWTSSNPKVRAWGIEFDGSAAATPISVELLTTGTVAATVTAHAAAGIVSHDWGLAAPTSGHPFTFSTTTTGYTATAEGTITTTRTLDAALIAPTNQFRFLWPLGTEFSFDPLNYLRIRVHAGAAVNALCWVTIDV